MKITFTAAKWIQDDAGFWIALKVADPVEARKFIGKMRPRKHVADLREWRAQRSLDANAYLWALIGELAEKLNVPPDEIYREAIRDIGGNYEVIPIRDDAVQHWMQMWAEKGIGWICEVIGQSKIAGYTNVRCFYGSSSYDTTQMSRLIDVIVNECKAQGIETLTPEKIEQIKAEWR